MTQATINKFFQSEIGQQCNSLFSTSDDRVFIRREEAVLHTNGQLDENTFPLKDTSIIEWFEEEEIENPEGDRFNSNLNS